MLFLKVQFDVMGLLGGEKSKEWMLLDGDVNDNILT